ncbi:class I SAM-dependent methyltransferase [Phormidesmis sp. 146-33]
MARLTHYPLAVFEAIEMNKQTPELLEKIRHQFDNAPYPRNPLEQSSKEDYSSLFVHSLVTPYYLKHQAAIDPKGKVILDAGCGTGFASLILAEANPGAKIVGIDLSEESIRLAKQRLQFHGFDQAEFHVLKIEDLPTLGLEFDYINCDEVLYLLPDPEVALRAMKSVLKPEGIIRGNLHSSTQRYGFYRAQKVFKLLGLMDSKPGDSEIEIAIETLKALKPSVELRKRVWEGDLLKGNNLKEETLLNCLLQGDKGYTILDMFAALETTDLEFLSMVNWRQWDLMELFREPDDLPVFWQLSFSEVPLPQQLRLFELFHPVHRLLDFWCTHPTEPTLTLPVSEWEAYDWQNAEIQLHPVLSSDRIKADLLESLKQHHPFEISKYIPTSSITPIILEGSQAACLLPLWEGVQTIESLIERWLQIRPVDPATLAPVTRQQAFEEVTGLLRSLEVFLYVLLGRKA